MTNNSFIYWGSKFFTSLGIIGPDFWQIQFNIHRNAISVIRQDAKYRHLAVVDLSKPSQPVPRDVCQHRPLLSKVTFINQQSGTPRITQEFVSLLSHMVDASTSIPFSLEQKLLQISRIELHRDFGYLLHIFSCTGLLEPASLLAALVRHIITAGAEIVAETFNKGHKTPADADERSLRRGIGFSPSAMALPCEVGFINIYIIIE